MGLNYFSGHPSAWLQTKAQHKCQKCSATSLGLRYGVSVQAKMKQNENAAQIQILMDTQRNSQNKELTRSGPKSYTHWFWRHKIRSERQLLQSKCPIKIKRDQMDKPLQRAESLHCIQAGEPLPNRKSKATPGTPTGKDLGLFRHWVPAGTLKNPL